MMKPIPPLMHLIGVKRLRDVHRIIGFRNIEVENAYGRRNTTCHGR
jgi:hypothetical protein